MILQFKMKADKISDRPTTSRELVQFYLIDYQTQLGKIIDIIIIFMNLLVCAIFVIDTYSISSELRTFLWRIEILAVVFFTIEYLARLYGAPDRMRQIVDVYSIIDLVAILPTGLQFFLPLFGLSLNITFVKTIRVFKVFRIFRFLRFLTDPHFFFGSVTLELLKVARLVMTMLIILFVFSGLFYSAESSINDQVQNFGDAFYFIVVALTTVGFGDITPASGTGRWITVLAILTGIILIPWQASQIVKEWIQISKKIRVTCPQCGLNEHDVDASYCKRCGHYLYYENHPEQELEPKQVDDGENRQANFKGDRSV